MDRYESTKCPFCSNVSCDIECNVIPSSMYMKLAGINPKNVAATKYVNRTLIMGDAKLMNQFGRNGVNLKKSK